MERLRTQAVALRERFLATPLRDRADTEESMTGPPTAKKLRRE
jgi:hypothetical protein